MYNILEKLAGDKDAWHEFNLWSVHCPIATVATVNSKQTNRIFKSFANDIINSDFSHQQ